MSCFWKGRDVRVAKCAPGQFGIPLKSSLKTPFTLAMGVKGGAGCPLWMGWRAADSREVWDMSVWEGGRVPVESDTPEESKEVGTLSVKWTFSSLRVLNFLKFILGKGKKKEKETPMCPDQGSNPKPWCIRMMLQSTKLPSQCKPQGT